METNLHKGEPQTGRRSAMASIALAGALIVVVTAVLLWALAPREAAPPSHSSVAGPGPTAEPAMPRRSPPGELATENPVPINPQSTPARRAAPSAPEPADAPVGIHAFPPLGTRPQLVGIIVPDDFELPPGYVRHFQSTDDGRRLAPILMFDPVQAPLDEFGQPMEIPPDRIVPPEMAPPGMPIIMLELPEPRNPDQGSLRGLLRSG